MTETKQRSFVKAITWRIIGTGTAAVIISLGTGDAETGMTLAALDAMINTVLFYFHERGWSTINWGTARD